MIYLFCSTVMHPAPLITTIIVLVLVLSRAGAAAPSADILGLPRYDHCAFAYNSSFYVFGGQQQTSTTLDGLRLSFTTISTAPVMEQLIERQPLFDNITLGAGCAVTSYGHALFLPPHSALLTYNIPTRQWIQPNIFSSHAALGSFNGTTAHTRSNMASAMWNDMWVVFGGQDNANPTQETFILDARVQHLWIWFEAPITSATPPPMSGSMMVATDRWVLNFATNTTNTTSDSIWQYNVAVHCFDPYVLMWLGPVVNFVSMTDQLHAAPVSPDSVLVVPASSSNSITNAGGLAIVPDQGLWRLDMSPDTAAGTIHWIGDAGPFQLLYGGTVTRLSEDILVIYGGVPFSHDSLRFWNTTGNMFVDPAWWREIQLTTSLPTPTETTGPTDSGSSNNNRTLAIVLGTVLGTLGLVIIIAVIYFYCCRKRRKPESRTRNLSPLSIRTNFTPRFSIESPEEDAGTWAQHLRRSLSNVAHNNRVRWSRSPPLRPEMSSSASPTADRPMISPSQRNLDDVVMSAEQQQHIRNRSRFNEHFDILAPPDAFRLSRIVEDDSRI
ncbi:hypothetical protein BJV82DRAFT_614663 [Fennellomyces sp. T-0311]|nr:hypothetical protein BJV82DRAFT_614663 [Fennellomyces sp. T-0311]